MTPSPTNLAPPLDAHCPECNWMLSSELKDIILETDIIVCEHCGFEIHRDMLPQSALLNSGVSKRKPNNGKKPKKQPLGKGQNQNGALSESIRAYFKSIGQKFTRFWQKMKGQFSTGWKKFVEKSQKWWKSKRTQMKSQWIHKSDTFKERWQSQRADTRAYRDLKADSNANSTTLTNLVPSQAGLTESTPTRNNIPKVIFPPSSEMRYDPYTGQRLTESSIQHKPAVTFIPVGSNLVELDDNRSTSIAIAEEPNEPSGLPSVQGPAQPQDIKDDDPYFNEVFMVLEPDVRERLMGLDIPEDDKNLIAKSFIYLTLGQQMKYLDEVEQVNQSSPDSVKKLVQVIRNLPIPRQQQDFLIDQLNYIPETDHSLFLSELDPDHSKNGVDLREHQVHEQIQLQKGLEEDVQIHLQSQKTTDPHYSHKSSSSHPETHKKDPKKRQITE